LISSDAYRKSTFSGGGGCVEVRMLADGMIGLRDSKNPEKPPHVFTQLEWRAFLAGVHAHEFDLPVEAD
jgi:hypothetical protein